jgi:hypothetical protein
MKKDSGGCRKEVGNPFLQQANRKKKFASTCNIGKVSTCNDPPLPALIKKENQIFLIYLEIQNGAVARSYMTNGLLIYGEIFAHFLIY